MNFDRLLAPIEGENPSGVELRHDLRFHDLERLTEPAARTARVNDDGSLSDAAPNVDWDRIISEGQELSNEGRDLRLLVLMTRAQFNLNGFEALSMALDFLAQTVAQHWDSLHPALRDRDDPKVAALPRLNAFRQLENDDSGLLGDMRFGVILNPRGIGPITGDDMALAALSDFEMLSKAASGLSQAEKDALTAAHGQRVNRVQAATRMMAAEDTETLEGLMAGISACEKGLNDLSDAVAKAAQFGDQPGLAMPEMQEFLAQCHQTLAKAVTDTAEDAPMVEDNPAATAADPKEAAKAKAPDAAAPAPSAPGTIASRADVQNSLDQIIAFYERTEPGSPMPHLARRMRRMVAMDFLEIMEEIAPSGLKEFRNVAGVDEGKKK
ncbi:type VI secretion system protein TssA [Lentibacter algarum]|uniref:type VI secretion system protein TssA n=1 Tax=Lentibacter algarum TaxID=576131 RepID=UPI001C074252|nr:type VI secretion system protein TssA [Lentibacter algarum]MBU2980561.1 type VI secretion system protein TssA [Lentibacter algarum]